MLGITRNNFLSYTLLPGFKPRVKEFFASGFQYIAYYMALVFEAVRLLPARHPYVMPANIGRFGMLHVIAEAANNIHFSRKNIDQIIVFTCVLMALGLIAMQIALILLWVFVSPASAQIISPYTINFFQTPNPENDLAFIMLDMVFGVPDLFGSCIDTGGVCTNAERGTITGNLADTNWSYAGTLPKPIHVGLHQVFQYYSLGLLVVATIITSYFIATIILETAESGTPFGKRFNKVWAPIRLVVAFGLLVPISYGMNASQYIVLYAAKYGSSFATNAWIQFNETLTKESGAAAGELRNILPSSDSTSENLVAKPNPPEIWTLLQFLFVAKTCAEMENMIMGVDANSPEAVKPYLVKTTMTGGDPYQAITGIATPDYTAMIDFAEKNSQIIVRFGRRNERDYNHFMGSVFPVCGDLSLKLEDPRPVDEQDNGAEAMQRYYWYVLTELWFSVYETGHIHQLNPDEFNGNSYPQHYACKFHGLESNGDCSGAGAVDPPAGFRAAVHDFYSRDLKNSLDNPKATGLQNIIRTADGAIIAMSESGRWKMDQHVVDKGWAGAAIWMNRIAEMNGGMTSAVLNVPTPIRYPLEMEAIYKQKRQSDQNTNFAERFKPVKPQNEEPQQRAPDEVTKADVLWESYSYWNKGNSSAGTSGDAITEILNALMGTSGLFDMRHNFDVHPLAQLAGVGRSLIEGAIRNLTYAAIGGISGAGLSALGEKFLGSTMSAVSSFLITFAMLGLTAGFILFYVVPMLPFIYFFFALSGWVKAIFEAMVGAPLWALAHIRIDGNGLSGQAALSGYYLILEIFLRPILMVMGLLASISIFSALVNVLNQVFELVVANLTGFDSSAEQATGGTTVKWVGQMRNVVDQFFYTIIYTIIVYMMSLSCFKLIDQIPSNILRWMGQNITTFNDSREDMGQQLVSTATMGTQQSMSAVGSGLQQVVGGKG